MVSHNTFAALAGADEISIILGETMAGDSLVLTNSIFANYRIGVGTGPTGGSAMLNWRALVECACANASHQPMASLPPSPINSLVMLPLSIMKITIYI